jgi:hypothetical protein
MALMLQIRLPSFFHCFDASRFDSQQFSQTYESLIRFNLLVVVTLFMLSPIVASANLLHLCRSLDLSNAVCVFSVFYF